MVVLGMSVRRLRTPCFCSVYVVGVLLVLLTVLVGAVIFTASRVIVSIGCTHLCGV